MFSLHPGLEEAIKLPGESSAGLGVAVGLPLLAHLSCRFVFCVGLSTLMAFKLFLEVLVLALYSSRHHAQADEIGGIMVLFLLLEVRIKQVPLEFMKKKKKHFFGKILLLGSLHLHYDLRL